MRDASAIVHGSRASKYRRITKEHMLEPVIDRIKSPRRFHGED